MNEILTKDSIILNANITSKDECFNFLVKKAIDLNIATDHDELYKSFWIREKEMSTGFTDGIAIPHAKSSCILRPAIIFIKNNTGIQWESLDGKLVNIIISIIVPQNSENDLHLRLLSKLAKKLMDENFRAQISFSNSVNDIYKELSIVLINT